MPVGVEQQILGLDVKVHDVARVQVRKRRGRLGDDKLRPRGIDAAHVHEHRVHIARQLHDQEDALLVLEKRRETDHIAVVERLEQ